MSKWVFALVNGKLAEVHHECVNGKTRFLGHAYVRRSEYKAKTERAQIKKDLEKYSFIFKNDVYIDKKSEGSFSLSRRS